MIAMDSDDHGISTEAIGVLGNLVHGQPEAKTRLLSMGVLQVGVLACPPVGFPANAPAPLCDLTTFFLIDHPLHVASPLFLAPSALSPALHCPGSGCDG